MAWNTMKRPSMPGMMKPVAFDAAHAQHIAAGTSRPIHPVMKTRAVAVRAAHAELSQRMPGFRSLPPAEQFAHVQRHVSQRIKG